MIGTFGAGPLGVWAIKHVVSPVHRWAYRLTGGMGVPVGTVEPQHSAVDHDWT